MPPGWHELPAEGARAFAPASGSVTVVLQARAAGPMPLDAALDAEFATLSASPELVWDQRTPVVLDGWPAIFYAVRYTHLEVPRRRLGILVSQPGGLIDVSANAPAATFHAETAHLADLLDIVALGRPRP